MNWLGKALYEPRHPPKDRAELVGMVIGNYLVGAMLVALVLVLGAPVWAAVGFGVLMAVKH